jgi:hypothetical protein
MATFSTYNFMGALLFPLLPGEKILAGASAGEVLFYDPHRKIEKAQFRGCNLKSVDDKKCDDIARRLLHLEKIFALGIGKENSHLTLRINRKTEPLTPEKFLWVIQPAAWKGTTKKRAPPDGKVEEGLLNFRTDVIPPKSINA